MRLFSRLSHVVMSGALIVTGGADCALRIYESRTHTCVCAVRSSGPVLATAFGPGLDAAAPNKGARVAVGGGSGSCQRDNSLSLFSAQPAATEVSCPASGAKVGATTKVATTADATEAVAEEATKDVARAATQVVEVATEAKDDSDTAPDAPAAIE